MTTKIRATLKTAYVNIVERNEFDCNGTLSGIAGERSRYVGQLPVEYHTAYTKAGAAQDFYVVKSYLTPIAWFADGEWYVPDVKYSATTSKHQSKLPIARRHRGEGYRT